MDSLYFAAIFYSIGGLVFFARHHLTRLPDIPWVYIWIANATLAALVAWAITDNSIEILATLIGGLSLSLAVRKLIPSLTCFGIGWLTCKFCLPLSFIFFINEIFDNGDLPLSAYSSAALYLILTFALIRATFHSIDTLQKLPRFTITYQKRYKDLEIIHSNKVETLPMISIHVPCYAEPPHLVISTLQAISRLRYDNFEVLVIDNNTKDENLWHPVQKCCTDLGGRFRFFHIDPISGAKAGAINFALKATHPDAEIITIIDADYIVYPDFLLRFVPLFEDKLTGFVQTSHDYREWRDNLFLSSVYFHYMAPHKTSHAALNEYDTAYLVGTMCMIRRSVLDEVGGWAEWSLTEDLEMAMRIMSRGYTGHVFAETWGRGLIPETMEGIKKQQFRWWAGANQDFMTHWRWYLGINTEVSLSALQRGFRIYAFLKDFAGSLTTLVDVILLLLCAELILTNTTILISGSLVAFLASILFNILLDNWISVKKLNGRGIRDYTSTLALKCSLRWTGVTAFAVPALKINSAWIRTNKFKQSSSLFRAIHSSYLESCIALSYFSSAIFLIPFANVQHFDLVMLTIIWVCFEGCSHMCTLIMAIISEKSLNISI